MSCRLGAKYLPAARHRSTVLNTCKTTFNALGTGPEIRCMLMWNDDGTMSRGHSAGNRVPAQLAGSTMVATTPPAEPTPNSSWPP